ncbi:hypothetical protein ACG0Z6_01215 [Roseateles sp. BYS180W]|uniref:Uncharacterized protein n=1 Tax=Roseateles rivi TaxID=3299028 RepID=A0ABW7FR91_9BURK
MNHTPSVCAPTVIGIPAKIGAWLFVLWGVLHVWVGAEGLRQVRCSRHFFFFFPWS